MIFDGHAYTFPPLTGRGGFDTDEQLRRHLQQAIAVHHQPARRARDQAPADTTALIESTNRTSLDAIKEAGFRAEAHGRFRWAADGEDYVKQYFPPSVTDMAYPADRLVAEMDYAGVNMALLHRTPYLGIGNDFIADCVRSYPDRLMGLAHVEEWLVATQPDATIAKLWRAVQEQELCGLHFLPPQLDLYNYNGPWDAPEFNPFWDAVAGLGIPMFFSLNPRKEPLLESYLEELGTLIRWMERYPNVQVVMTHGLSWRLFMDGDSLSINEDVWKPFDSPNLHLQFLFPIALGGVWDYPMPQVRRTIEQCVERIGAERLMWGTDMPIVTRFWTYKQNIDFIQDYCDFLSAEEMKAIMGGTMAKMLGVVG